MFGLFAMLALVYAGSFWLPALSRFVRFHFGGNCPLRRGRMRLESVWLSPGWLGVFSSMMIYRDTRRTFWRMRFTAPKFTGTMLLLGPATILFTMTLQSVFSPLIATQPAFRHVVSLLCEFVAVTMTAKLLWESAVFVHLNDPDWTDMKRTALLMSGVLKQATIRRFIFGGLGGVLLPVLSCSTSFPPVFAIGILPLSLLGELFERYLFFTAVIPPKMPGGIAS